MISTIFEVLSNAFDPLYVDDRCELQKKKDKEGWIIISILMTIAIGIAYIKSI